jgi:hypothetical protein
MISLDGEGARPFPRIASAPNAVPLSSMTRFRLFLKRLSDLFDDELADLGPIAMSGDKDPRMADRVR